MPPRQRPPRRTPRSVVYRRRFVALGVLAAGAIGLTAAIAGIHRRGAQPKPTTTLAAPKPFHVVFPEGYTRHDMAERIKAVDRIAHRERGVRPELSPAQYLRLTGTRQLVPLGFRGNARNLEGFLFPATYAFTARTTSLQLLRAQLAAFRRNWSRVNLGYARSKQLTPYDVLTIASMIEKEAVAPEERPKIARVIYNRLHLRMPLGIDATIRYAYDVPGNESLRESQLNRINPYNTRRVAGLPPTPISNPGLASIQAAAHPATGDWLYFVRKPDKVHHFFTPSKREFDNYKNAHGFG
jgi:uncharacterized YceG family protein